MAISDVTLSKCSPHLGAYKSACEIHPDLKSFDSSLQQRTNKALDSLTAEAEKRTNIVKNLLTAKAEKRPEKETAEAETELLLSDHAVHKEVTSHLHEVFQDVANIIVDSKVDVWENKALRSLVQAYLDNTRETINILDKIENCVEKADVGQRVILQAVAQFDIESAENVVGGKKKYEKTLNKLKKFKAMGDPFSGSEIKNQFKLVKEQQESLLGKVSEAITALQEEISNLHRKSVISNAVFGAVLAVTAVVSIALIAFGAGAVVVSAGIGLGLSLPLTAMGWVVAHTTLEKQIDDLKRQEEALKELKKKYESVGQAIEINIHEMEIVSQHVNRLETKILSILEVVDDAIENENDETDIRFDLNSVREKVVKLTEGIKEVGEAVSCARKLIDKARNQVMEKITDSA